MSNVRQRKGTQATSIPACYAAQQQVHNKIWPLCAIYSTGAAVEKPTLSCTRGVTLRGDQAPVIEARPVARDVLAGPHVICLLDNPDKIIARADSPEAAIIRMQELARDGVPGGTRTGRVSTRSRNNSAR